MAKTKTDSFAEYDKKCLERSKKLLRALLDDMEDRNDHTGYDVVEAIVMDGLTREFTKTQINNRIKFWKLRQKQGGLGGDDVALREELRKDGKY